MTNQTSLALLPRWAGRTTALAAATLVLSLSCGTGAHADGGLLDDVTEVVGGATQPVQPVVETVQSAIPQPVQEVVEPVVEQVVEPTVSQVEQGLGVVPGAGEAAEPVVEVVKETVRGSDAPVKDPAAGDAEPFQAPVAPQAPAVSESPASAPSGSNGSHSSDGPGHQAEPGSASTGSTSTGSTSTGSTSTGSTSTGSPRADDATALAGACDLPPRALAVLAMAQQFGSSDAYSADQTVWDLAYALMQMWTQGPLSQSFTPDRQEDGAFETRTSGLTKAQSPAVLMPGTDATGAVGMLEVLGLGLLLLLLAGGLTVVLTHQDEQPA